MGLQKMYLGKTTPAVRDLWLGVAPGECFGLLGINGCGKTTTFRIAAGDLPPTRGRVSIAAGAGGVGYCPQRDALFPTLTVVEHLRLARAARDAARKRDADGDTRDASTDSVGAAILDAGLERFADVPAGHLSGGNKRKLCLAMSLLGLEKGGLALLDEPTAGVDPGARDAITRAVRAAARARRCAVVVTSHSIEDAAALCQRVGVMVDGALLCVGPPQRLRTNHGKHLTLVAHPKAPEANALPLPAAAERSDPDAVAARVEAIVRGVVPGAKRVGGGGGGGEEEEGAAASSASDSAAASEAAARAKALARIESDATASLTWELPASAAGAIPETLEALERETGPDGVLEGFAVGQASLEDVFLEFAAKGAEQSDAQLMALEDALFAYRKGLSSRAAGEPAEKER
jgi:ABC-type multidrug transport system ATPase subunit